MITLDGTIMDGRSYEPSLRPIVIVPKSPRATILVCQCEDSGLQRISLYDFSGRMGSRFPGVHFKCDCVDWDSVTTLFSIVAFKFEVGDGCDDGSCPREADESLQTGSWVGNVSGARSVPIEVGSWPNCF